VGARLSANSPYNDMGSPDSREHCTHALGALDAFLLGARPRAPRGRPRLRLPRIRVGGPFTLAEARRATRRRLIAVCGHTGETAEEAVAAGAAGAAGAADLASFGGPFISNPDPADRPRHGWPLVPPAEIRAYCAPGPEGSAARRRGGAFHLQGGRAGGDAARGGAWSARLVMDLYSYCVCK
jgi:N-ethylmaleimide reductase